LKTKFPRPEKPSRVDKTESPRTRNYSIYSRKKDAKTTCYSLNLSENTSKVSKSCLSSELISSTTSRESKSKKKRAKGLKKLQKLKKFKSFVEKFSEFEHLLDEEHKLVFAELKKKWKKMSAREKRTAELSAKTAAYSSVKDRTKAQVGTGYVDNKRGELQKLATPGYETLSLFLTKLEKKVLWMIDSLILHLKNSRDSLTKNELKAAEDFAIFQKNMFKENRFLRSKIKQLQAHLVDLKTQLTKAKAQLVRREKLKKEAEAQLASFRRMKAEKDSYCKKEHARRLRELHSVDSAEKIFQNVLNKMSIRVKFRTQNKIEGKKYSKREKYAKEVLKARKGTESGLSSRIKDRAELAY